MSDDSFRLGTKSIDLRDCNSSRAYRFLKEGPLVLVVALLSWTQYAIGLSLSLNYLILTRGDYLLALSCAVPFETLWTLAVWSLVACVAWGPGFVEQMDGGEASKIETEADDDEDELGLGDQGDAPLLGGRPEIRRGFGGGRTVSAFSVGSATTLPPPYPIRSRHASRSPRSTPASSRGSNEDGDGHLDIAAALNLIPVPSQPTAVGGALMCKSDGSRRFCRKCNTYKPDRAHHCSTCERCVLKMDHSCPWLGSRCVGLRNYKPFLLFITYTSLLSLVTAVAAANGLALFVRSDPESGFELAPLNWAFMFLLGTLFSLVLGGFTCYHIWLAGRNRTTIENMERSLRVRPVSQPGPERDAGSSNTEVGGQSYALLRPHRPLGVPDTFPPLQSRPPDGAEEEAVPAYSLPVYKSDDTLSRSERRKLEQAAGRLNVYDLGWKGNWLEILGRESKTWEWFLPVRPRGVTDGFSFRVNKQHLTQLQELTAQVRLVPCDRTHELRFERP